jgi:hypothetical protein
MPQSPVFRHLVLALGRGLVDDLQTAHVGATARADPVGQCFLAALLAIYQLWCADGVVGAAAIPASLANFAFWQRSHLELSLIF